MLDPTCNFKVSHRDKTLLRMKRQISLGDLQMLLMGIIFLLCSLHNQEAIEAMKKNTLVVICAIPVFILFAVIIVVSLWNILSRCVLELDRKRRKVRLIKSFLTTSTEEYDFSEIVHVIYESDIRHFDLVTRLNPEGFKVFSWQVWAVSICTKANWIYHVRTGLNELAIRDLAEELAGFLEVPIRDQSGSKTVVRKHGELDTPLAGRSGKAAQGGNSTEGLMPPPDMAIVFEYKEGKKVRYLLAHPGVLSFWGFFVLVGGLVLYFTARSPQFSSPAGQAIFLIAMSMLAFSFARMLAREEIVIQGDSLETALLVGPFRMGARKIQRKEIEQVMVDDTIGRGTVKAIGDRKILRFGGRLSREHQEWLCGAIECAILNLDGHH